jgi:hypothetical protein
LDEAKKKKTALPPPVFPSEGAQTGQLGSKSVPERKSSLACVCVPWHAICRISAPGFGIQMAGGEGGVGRGTAMTTIVLDLGLEAKKKKKEGRERREERECVHERSM